MALVPTCLCTFISILLQKHLIYYSKYCRADNHCLSCIYVQPLFAQQECHKRRRWELTHEEFQAPPVKLLERNDSPSRVPISELNILYVTFCPKINYFSQMYVYHCQSLMSSISPLASSAVKLQARVCLYQHFLKFRVTLINQIDSTTPFSKHLTDSFYQKHDYLKYP